MSGGTIKLPAQLVGDAASGLRDMIVREGVGGREVLLDASEVETLGGLCLQVILASKAKIINPSTKAEEFLSLFGVQEILAPASPATGEA
ncbi:hypothetical protein AA14337_3023 [Acetobacter malorum DSM 14337]|uniref:STAS domain-containing protein n=2 Tax=Acetobacter malorum TaxID=178901 RepID=A0ABQ0PZ79_9PROT|nr:STAS domain-containing protein [Acetobacter malorum]KXV05618.1 hypothetical protein AD930_10770 [Acetobacter malorum]GBQ85253.1 hypothetical protein AA14337_3023 [Acetobacter malorum DSM 14337]